MDGSFGCNYVLVSSLLKSKRWCEDVLYCFFGGLGLCCLLLLVLLFRVYRVMGGGW